MKYFPEKIGLPRKPALNFVSQQAFGKKQVKNYEKDTCNDKISANRDEKRYTNGLK
ncbi:hypothetical protein PBAL39_00125 [Pedobacter sp. BAL39]|nr:hypothetical protein PBAL39_00125 [Pedobacter sp. BAL39]